MLWFLLICILILSILSYSIYYLISKGNILVKVNLIQPFLFYLLFSQIAATFGPQHYRYDSEPRWYHWVQFTGAHILRATDVLDFFEEYNIDLQNIKHNSKLSSIAIIIMHWIVGAFLIACIVRFISTRVKNRWEKLVSLFQKIWIPAFILFILAYIITVVIQGWRLVDLLFWWPVDNAIRAVDVGDTFQIFQWQLHQVESGWWNSILAIAFRLGSGIVLGYYINILRMRFIGGAGRTIEALRGDLSHSNKNVRKAAAAALGKRGAEARPAIPDLIKALADKDKYVRGTAAYALGEIGAEARQAVPDLIKALADKDKYVRWAAAKALGMIGPEARSAIPALAQALAEKESALVWNAAAEALLKIDPQWHKSEEVRQAIPKLIKALADKSEYVRKAVAKALSKIGPKAIPALINALADKDKYVRGAAAYALGMIGPEAKQAVPPLIQALEDESEWVRKAAAEALGKIGPGARQAIPGLIKALADLDTGKYKDWSVTDAAIVALSKIDPQRGSMYGGLMVECLVLKKARQAILPALTKALENILNTADEYEDVRKAAAEALDKIKSQ